MVVLPLLLHVSCLMGPSCPSATPTPTAKQKLSQFAGRHPVRSEKGAQVQIDDDLVNKLAGETPGETTPVQGAGEQKTNPAKDPKDYWVNRYRTTRNKLKAVEVQFEKKEDAISELWESFYHEDDPKSRDQILAPKLRRELELRSDLKKQLKQLRQDFEELKVAARKAGAKPGWFRIP